MKLGRVRHNVVFDCDAISATQIRFPCAHHLVDVEGIRADHPEGLGRAAPGLEKHPEELVAEADHEEKVAAVGVVLHPAAAAVNGRRLHPVRVKESGGGGGPVGGAV